MKFEKACQVLSGWINQSKGEMVLLPSGEEYSFKLLKRYNEAEIEKFEENSSLILPESYKYFLTTVGASKCFMSKYGTGFIFHELDSLSQHSSKVFLELEDPFPQLLLIISLTGRGDEGGFEMNRKTNENFSVFSHEEDPEEWSSDTDTWCSFESWLSKLVDSEGEDDLP
jgi:hypothetical protein